MQKANKVYTQKLKGKEYGVILQPVVLPIGKTLNHYCINKNFIIAECMHKKSTIKTYRIRKLKTYLLKDQKIFL